MITDPHKLYAAYDEISSRYYRIEPLSAIPKKLRDSIEKRLFDFSQAYESKPWGSATLYQTGRVPKWTATEMQSWNKFVADTKALIEQAATLPKAKVITKKEYKEKIAKAPAPAKVAKLEPTVITGKYPWMLGLGAAIVFLAMIQRTTRKKALSPLPSRGLSGTRDQHAADAWHHLSRFSDLRVDYLQALSKVPAAGSCKDADRLRIEMLSELAIAKAFRRWAPKPRQHDIMDGIRVRRRQMADNESHYKFVCTKIPLQTRLF